MTATEYFAMTSTTAATAAFAQLSRTQLDALLAELEIDYLPRSATLKAKRVALLSFLARRLDSLAIERSFRH